MVHISQCIKETANLTHVATNLKLDSTKFDKKLYENILPEISPKLEALFENIEKLDKIDYKKDKIYYKHCVYIDFKGVFAKTIASSFIAKGYNLVYDKNHKYIEKKGDNNMLFLSSSVVYGKPIGVKLRKSMMEVFNSRPDNINGEKIRFIVLDSGYREGLDCFDIKYVHLLESLDTPADEKQAIGRSTRLCGQSGLNFDNKKGWVLNVYKYDVLLTDELQDKLGTETMFDLYMKNSNINVFKIRFGKEIDQIIEDAAADEPLTKNIHKFSIDESNNTSNSSDTIEKNDEKIDGGSRVHLHKQNGRVLKPINRVRAEVPKMKRTLNGLHKFVKKHFSEFKWDKVKLENKCQIEGAGYKITEFNPTQNFVRHYFQPDSVYKGLALFHSVGTGKCHAKDTPILMYDGSIKNVQDIEVGELLMGDDSSPREVLSLASGEDDMYDIIPNKGDKYTVNSEHILCLYPTKLGVVFVKKENNYYAKYIDNKSYKIVSKSFKTKEEGNKFLEDKQKVIEITVNDYLKLPINTKNQLKGYRVGVDFSAKEVEFDPYIIGYWLGDGSKRDTVISCQDSAVLYYINKEVQKYNLMLNYYSNYDYRITSYDNKSNILNRILKKLDLINNKHIPNIYKCNSREIRLKLLAGLIDSDGHYDKKSGNYEFTQKNEKLMDDVIYLARSLGFSCYKKVKKTTWTYKEEKKIGSAFRIFINGKGIEEIPCLIPRKIAQERKQIKNLLYTGIDVKYVNRDKYYGFTLDGNSRYLLGDFTVTHNTCSSIAIASTSWEQKGYTILYVTRHTLKSDVYKNMFKEVCSLVVKDKIEKKELELPLKKGPKNYLTNQWIEPISFKQFSNLCEGKNELYREMVKRNGAKDPLRKTLVVLDEAHKLFANDVIGSEKPNTKVIIDTIAKSYKLSGNDSARVLLMTATPYTSDPMDFIKLMNIIREEDEQFPSDFKEFSDEYLDDEGRFSIKSKKERFMNELGGTISYLNREKDVRQFAYPVIKTIDVEMSESKMPKIDINKMKEKKTKLEEVIENKKLKVKEIKTDAKEDKNNCNKKPVKERKKCKEDIEYNKKKLLEKLDVKEEEKEIKEIDKDIKKNIKEIKEAKENDMSQEKVLEKCIGKKLI